MRRAGLLTLALCGILSASDARFTEELWVPIEPQYQKLLAAGVSAHQDQSAWLTQAIRESLTTLAAKAPNDDWRAFLIEDAARLEASKHAGRMSRATEDYAHFLKAASGGQSFKEGLSAVLAEYWINFELRKDRAEHMSPEFIEEVAQLTRMMNSTAARLDGQGHARLKEAFQNAARRKFAFEEQ